MLEESWVQLVIIYKDIQFLFLDFVTGTNDMFTTLCLTKIKQKKKLI